LRELLETFRRWVDLQRESHRGHDGGR
jgi:hypothetical protein